MDFGEALQAIKERPLPYSIGMDLMPKKEQAMRELSCEEAQKIFGTPEAVKMNFIPQMLIAVALDEATQWVNYCSEEKIKCFLKHNRVIRMAVEHYTEHLRESYGPAFKAYSMYAKRYFEYVAIDRLKMLYSIGNVVKGQLSDPRGYEGATRIAIIHHLLDFAEKFDIKADHRISEKLNTVVQRKRNDYLLIITAMCEEFEQSYGFEIQPDPMIDANLKVLANRASTLADILIEEESVSKR